MLHPRYSRALLIALPLALVLALVLNVGPPAAAAPGVLSSTGITTRVSVASDGTEANLFSSGVDISADGRYVAFESEATNLVAGDTNNRQDIFVHDRLTGETTRVSVATDGTQANNPSYLPSISDDGRYVAFYSIATNLVPDDTNGRSDVFVHDRQTGETTRVSVATGGTQGDLPSSFPSISGDGRYVVFQSSATNLVDDDTNGHLDIFLHDRQTHETTRISKGPLGVQTDDWSTHAVISSDASTIAYLSRASNLVPGDTNGADDIFVYDRETGTTRRASVATGGAQANGQSLGRPGLSADGRYVTFVSLATNLVPLDTNSHSDIFVHDLSSTETTRVSVASDGTEANDQSWTTTISADGRYVAFSSNTTNLASGDVNASDVFWHDQVTGETLRVSVASDGSPGNSFSWEPAISGDGRVIAFASYASNLVAGDTNGEFDIFVRELADPTPPRYLYLPLTLR
jgi:Tol biopolymer transport system component